VQAGLLASRDDLHERAFDFSRWNSRRLEVVVEQGKIAAIRPTMRGYGGQASEYAEKKSLISMEIILRPVLSIFMCTARLAATRWKPRLKRFVLFAISTRVRHDITSAHDNDSASSRNRQGLASGSRLSISDQRDCRCSCRRPFISKAKAGAQRAEFIQDRHRLLCRSCSDTRRY